jgi:hypothetical protein
MIDRVIQILKDKEEKYRNIRSFSESAGIYALFFHGKSFPLEGVKPAINEIIYIGKTEKSQKSRDQNTHFATGKTRRSTLRRTFGALLREKENLKPIVISQRDIEVGKLSNFLFDDRSEQFITDWMVNNLGLSFYPFPKSKQEIKSLETRLIKKLVPILNIDNTNPTNPYLSTIRGLRKQCGEIAYKNKPTLKVTETNLDAPPKLYVNQISAGSSVRKYEDIWSCAVSKIIDSVNSRNNVVLILDEKDFSAVGKRKSYAFRLQYINGVVSNNIGGSAVARDLARVLEKYRSFNKVFKGKEVAIRLDKDFMLHIYKSGLWET